MSARFPHAAQEPARLRVAALLADAEREAAELAAEEIPDALGDLERLKARLLLRLTAGGARGARTEPDRLLTVKEAAGLLSITNDTLYRKAAALPFTRRVGGALRFSSRGLQQWLRDRPRT